MRPISFEEYKLEKAKRESNPKHALAGEIYDLWGLEFTRIMRMIKLNGIQCIRECFEEAKKAPRQPAIGLFIWLVNKNKTNIAPAQEENEYPLSERVQDGFAVYQMCVGMLMEYGKKREEAREFLKTF